MHNLSLAVLTITMTIYSTAKYAKKATEINYIISAKGSAEGATVNLTPLNALLKKNKGS